MMIDMIPSNPPKKTRTKTILDLTHTLPPQTPREVLKGVTIRRTKGDVAVTRVHYIASKLRDPDINPDWKKTERRAYTSQAAWDREQECRDDAGGGELVLANTLTTYWDKIVITAPEYRPHPKWRCEAGFDHGKTNPSALVRCYIDYDGCIILCGEYYMPGLEIWEHSLEIRKMEDIDKIAACYADPSIFPNNQQQTQLPGRPAERAKSFNELYVEQGIALFSPFALDRSDVSFAGRLMMHWANLDKRQPTLKIVCRNYSERPQPGLHNWDCPNLLWEMMRARREKLSAQQLLSRNVSEAIVQKDNHAWDACKYLVMSHPEPTLKTMKEIAAEAVAPLAAQGDLTSAAIRYAQITAEQQRASTPARIGRYRRS